LCIGCGFGLSTAVLLNTDKHEALAVNHFDYGPVALMGQLLIRRHGGLAPVCRTSRYAFSRQAGVIGSSWNFAAVAEALLRY